MESKSTEKGLRMWWGPAFTLDEKKTIGRFLRKIKKIKHNLTFVWGGAVQSCLHVPLCAHAMQRPEQDPPVFIYCSASLPRGRVFNWTKSSLGLTGGQALRIQLSVVLSSVSTCLSPCPARAEVTSKHSYAQLFTWVLEIQTHYTCKASTLNHGVTSQAPIIFSLFFF